MRTTMIFMLRAVLALLAGFLCLDSGAWAGVTIVNDGADGSPAIILIQSAIRKGDLQALEIALNHVEHRTATRINDVPFVTVELNSPGGDVVEALGMGRAIYRNLAMTMVRPGQECVSACVFIFAAGAVRTPAEGASIGVHRPLLVSWTNMTGAQARSRYNELMGYLHDYFRELGIADSAFDIMMRTSSYGMRYFSPSELSDLNFRGESPRWSQYFSKKTATVSTASLPVQSFAQLPKLPKIDESYRYLVFMPGAYHAGVNYFDGMEMPTPHFTWASLDDDNRMISADAPNLNDLSQLIRRIAEMLAPLRWLIVLAIYELLRGAYRPWPVSGRTEAQERWRLTAFNG